jgi:hypothetical protein
MSPLILECVRAHPDPGELRRLCASSPDWGALIESAGLQDLAPLVFWALNRGCPDAVPPEALSALRSRFRRNTVRNLLFAKELLRLLSLFDSAGIQAVPFKGPAIAWSLYETPGLRFICDLDFLVSARDVKRAIDLLESNGYPRVFPGVGVRFFSAAGQMPLRRADGEFEIDLHWRLAAAHFNPLDTAGIRERLAPVDVAGHPIPTLCPEDLLAYLCVHGAKGGWSLAMVCDLDRLIAVRGLDWDAILARADRRRMSRIVSLGLSLAHGLLGSKLPPRVSNFIHADTRALALASSIRKRILDDREGDGGDRGLLQLHLLQGVRNRFRFVWYLLQPTDDDWRLLRIPESLFPLYYLVKPVQLAWRWRLRPVFGLKRTAGTL